MLIIYIPFAFPAIGTFIFDRPRSVFWAGVALITGGFAAMMAVSFTSAYFNFPVGITGTDPISIATMWIMMAGIALTVLPRSMAALKRTEKAATTPKPAEQVKNIFSGKDEAWVAIRAVTHNWAPFARIFGPWIALLWIAPFVGLHIAAYSNGMASSLFAVPIGKMDVVTELLAERLPLLAVSIFAFPIALVGWHRYLLTSNLPAIGLGVPMGATARYLWRLWMILFLFSILVRLVASNAPDVARLLGTSNTFLVGELLFWGVLGVEVYVGCSFALVLPAVAIENRNFVGTDSVRVSKPLGNSFRVGFVLSLLPFALACLATVQLFQHLEIAGPQLSLAGYSLWLVPTALMFLALASCATYLSRVYAAQIAADR